MASGANRIFRLGAFSIALATLVTSSAITDSIAKKFTEQQAAFLSNTATHADLTSGYGSRHTVLWDFFLPTNICPQQYRLGRLGDGGKWLCQIEDLLQEPGCVVYSIGSNGELSFELDILEYTKCDLHIFDPTLSTAKEMVVKSQLPAGRAFFHRWGVGAQANGQGHIAMLGAEFYSLDEIMQRLGHSWVDVLKCDIEGGEWEVFPPVFAQDAKPKFGQLQIELHAKARGAHSQEMVQSITNFFGGAKRHGYEIFHVEPNIYRQNRGSLLCEYAFVKTDGAGNVVRRPAY